MSAAVGVRPTVEARPTVIASGAKQSRAASTGQNARPWVATPPRRLAMTWEWGYAGRDDGGTQLRGPLMKLFSV